jgi:hypothetical protein
MNQGEKSASDEQWGSCKGRSANTVVQLEVLTYELMELMKTEMAEL